MESSASRRYVLDDDEAPDVPAVGGGVDGGVDGVLLELLLDVEALARMKCASLELAPAVPVVPVAPEVALAR